MDEQLDDPDEAVTRLEAALERIARLAGRPPLPDADPADTAPVPSVPVEEIASRLDQLIDRLRVAVANKPG
jgi:outer membrane protein TolC